MLHCNITRSYGFHRASNRYTCQIKETQMNNNFEQFAAGSKANMQALENLTSQAYSSVEKLVELNLATSKALLGESFSHLQSFMGAKNAQELQALQSGLLQPLAEKSASYFQHVQTIATGNGAEFTKAFEAKIAQAQNTFGSVVENLSRNAPAGTESAMAAFKSALSAGQNAVETAQASAKQAAEMAQTNFTKAAAQAVDAVTKATRGAKTARAA
ncbi:MAG: phasin family protein [Rhodoferax sp.]